MSCTASRSGVGSLLRTTLLSPREKAQAARLLGGIGRIDTATLVGTTVRDWIDDAARGRVAELLEMLVRITTYTNAPDQLDAGAAAESVKAGIDRRASATSTAASRRSSTGWPTRPRRLGVELRTGAPVTGIEPGADGFRLTGTGRADRRRLGRGRDGRTRRRGAGSCPSARRRGTDLGPAVHRRLPRARPAPAARARRRVRRSTSRCT